MGQWERCGVREEKTRQGGPIRNILGWERALECEMEENGQWMDAVQKGRIMNDDPAKSEKK